MKWLRAEMDDRGKTLVSTLWCVICREYDFMITTLYLVVINVYAILVYVVLHRKNINVSGQHSVVTLTNVR